jgi:hypothetical protein
LALMPRVKLLRAAGAEPVLLKVAPDAPWPDVLAAARLRLEYAHGAAVSLLVCGARVTSVDDLDDGDEVLVVASEAPAAPAAQTCPVSAAAPSPRGAAAAAVASADDEEAAKRAKKAAKKQRQREAKLSGCASRCLLCHANRARPSTSVSRDGRVCHAALDREYHPGLALHALLPQLLMSLLCQPASEDPLNKELALLFYAEPSMLARRQAASHATSSRCGAAWRSTRRRRRRCCARRSWTLARRASRARSRAAAAAAHGAADEEAAGAGDARTEQQRTMRTDAHTER